MRSALLLVVVGVGTATLAAAEPAEYRTVLTAKTTKIVKGGAANTGVAAYLGVMAVGDAAGKLVVDDVELDSPAARAGLRSGDVIAKIDDKSVGNAEALREILQGHSPSDRVKFALVRGGEPVDVVATLGAVSRPMKLSQQRAYLGIQVSEPKEDEGAPIDRVIPGSPAATAGILPGDVLLKFDEAVISGGSANLRDALSEKRPGDLVTLLYRRGDATKQARVALTVDPGFPRRGGPSWDSREPTLWKKNSYRLAVLCVEFPDVGHNEQVTVKDWDDALFSRRSFNKTNATGQTVYGSMADYYQELSCGTFRVDGKIFPWIKASKNRSEYNQGTGGRARTALLIEVIDKLLERDGKNALRDFDGLFFLYAGGRVQTNRGGLYWPHRATLSYEGHRWAYYICPEGGQRMTNISVISHEFGHMLGLPDLYARPENPGSEGLGMWCAMSNQSPNGRPQHFCAWAKEQLGWLRPTVIDPTVPQRLILSPIENSPRECFKVLVRRDGSEYFLLENRRKIGFDESLSGEGLLIWRVVNNKPILEESHGVEGPAGPAVFPRAVPYPSEANHAFTPYTIPSSRSQLGGGLPVYITNIRRQWDGRITFAIGFEYQ